MPRSVIVLSNDPNLLQNVRSVLLADGRFEDAGDNLHCDGSAAPLTNIYATEISAAEWEGWSSNHVADPQDMSTLIFECRSSAWVAEVGGILAAGIDAAVWFVDAADFAWPAAEVDPDRVRLA